MVSLHPDMTRTSFWTEIFIWVWSGTLYVEELREIVKRDSTSLSHKVSDYLSSLWNWYDQIAILLLLIAIMVRIFVSDDDFGWARMFYCLTLIVYYVRFMQAFFAVQNLGPKVIMIKEMMVDLSFFLLILLVFILAYEIAAQALLYPNAAPSWSLLKNVVYQPYWQMYGELFLEEIEGNILPCTNDTSLHKDLPQCTQNNAFVIVLFVIFMIMTNVLLLNLLIAMFSNTFERVQDNSEKLWRFYRYSMIYEYYDKPTVVPPFIIINHFLRFLKFVCKTPKINHDLKISFSKPIDARLTGYEEDGMKAYLRGKLLQEGDDINVKVKTTGDRIEKVIDNLESIKTSIVPLEDNMFAGQVQPPTPQQSSINPGVTDMSKCAQRQDVKELNQRMNVVESQLGVIIDLLKSDPQRSILERPRLAFTNKHITVTPENLITQEDDRRSRVSDDTRCHRHDKPKNLRHRGVGHYPRSSSPNNSNLHSTGILTMQAPPP